MMIRRCAICRKREEAYKMLRIYVDREKKLQFCDLQAYKPSIRMASAFLYKDPKRGQKLSTWICIKESCLSTICKKPKILMLGKIFYPQVQMFYIFAKELHRYINHLHRQGGKSIFENELPKNAHFIFIQTENLSLRKNEIYSVKNTTNVYLYKELLEEYSPNQMHNIALHDLSKKKKHQNRRQRISTILDIWAKLRYID